MSETTPNSPITHAVENIISSVAAWDDRETRSFVITSLCEKLGELPIDRLVQPAPIVAGPALLALRFANYEPLIQELYVNLLATAIDSQSAKMAHPAYVEILRQLTSDEVRILRLFPGNIRKSFPLITIRSKSTRTSGGEFIARHLSLIGQQAGCETLDLVPNYLVNMDRLGLVEIKENYEITARGAYDELENHPAVREIISTIRGDDARADYIPHFERFHEIQRETLLLTDFGVQFINACVVGRGSG